MSVGANIRARREALGLTQSYLSGQAGITQAMLCQIERETKNPSLQIGRELARLLDCTIEDLFTGEV